MAEAMQTFTSVQPPKRKGGGREGVSEELAKSVADALENAEGDGWISDGRDYDTQGKAQGGARRLRNALAEYGLVDSVEDVQTRVWPVGELAKNAKEDKRPRRFALRLKESEPE